MSNAARLAGLLTILLAAACSSDAPADVTVDGSPDLSLSAEVASYDLIAGRPTRFLVGVFTNDNQRALAFGKVRFDFTYLGTRDAPQTTRRPAMARNAEFLPIPGQSATGRRPSLVPGSVAMGVYRAADAVFDRPGFWEVTVSTQVDGDDMAAAASFEVASSSELPAPGEAAPAVAQPLRNATDVPLSAIDSRAGDGEPIPDPELHDITVREALAARRPLVVVVSTPTYCVSRFCGPITDEVARLAAGGDGEISFVHLELWRDFEEGVLNEAAAAWVSGGDTDEVYEPWVFTIDRSGTILRRFDNVVSDDELAGAIAEVGR
jgi:hypothetical protein